MSTMNVLDASGATVAVEKPLAPGQTTMALSRPVVIASDQPPVAVSGTVGVSGFVAVTGTFFQATQPVSLAGLPALATGANVIGGVTQSGTWNVGLTGSAAVSTINGVAQAYGTGVRGATVQRVTIATDDVVPASQSGTWNITTLTNLSQFGGAAINLGAGAVGTGTLRITQASDSPLVAAVGTTADAAWASGNGTQIALLKAIAGAAIDTTTASPVKDANTGEYETVAASAAAQVIGGTGAAGDYFSHIIIVPATTSPGAVSITDGAGSAITIFAGGASSVTSLAPITVALDLKSLSGAWKVTTGTNVSAIAVGNFT